MKKYSLSLSKKLLSLTVLASIGSSALLVPAYAGIDKKLVEVDADEREALEKERVAAQEEYIEEAKKQVEEKKKISQEELNKASELYRNKAIDEANQEYLNRKNTEVPLVEKETNTYVKIRRTVFNVIVWFFETITWPVRAGGRAIFGDDI
jgi:hypothetical protein